MNPFDPGYWRTDELRRMGLAVGTDVMIAKNCTIIGEGNESFENIQIGHDVRIDGLTTIAAATGHLTIGSYVHIGAYCFLACRGGVTMEDFSGLSQGVALYSASDDYTGRALTNPTVPAQYLEVSVAAIHLGRHVIVGAGAVILPGVTIEEGSAVGALSLVHTSLPGWGVYAGSPARLVKPRSKAMLDKERAFLGVRG